MPHASRVAPALVRRLLTPLASLLLLRLLPRLLIGGIRFVLAWPGDRGAAWRESRLAAAATTSVRPTGRPSARHLDAHPATRLDRLRDSLDPRRPRPGLLAGLRAVAVHPRALPTGLAALVVAAGLVSVVPAATGSTPSQAVLGAAAAPRILAFGGPLRAAAAPATGNTGREVQLRQAQALALLYGPDPAVDASDAVGPFIVSGPRYVAVAPDAAARLRHYRIRSGDTLVTIARQFHVSVSTIWWANRLTSPTRLPVGKTLTIPPVNGLVIVVAAGDTLQSIAEATNVDVQAIVDENQLPNDEVFVGQTLIVPGAKGAPLPQPKSKPTATTPAPKPPAPKRVSISGGWVFPVVGGGAYISQYFHASHPAIDIAADYGTPVRAAHAGTVIFAGWKNNGGGWQVWMSHGSNVYTTYNHMSSLTVHTGQTLGAGQQVGRIGQSGWATGPHCHFEVWIGPIWNGGTRVNPLNYV